MLFLQSPKYPLKRSLAQIILAFGLGFTGLSASTLLWANAEISIPENVIVLAIDGQETGNTGFFTKKHTTYSLPAGEHTLTGRYDGVFGDDIVKSSGVTIKTSLADQQVYTLGWLPEPQTEDDATKFVKQPTLIITAADGKVVASQQGAIAPSHSIIEKVITGIGQLTGNDAQQVTPLQQLQSSWQQATAEQRKQFREWIKQQPDQ
ncbi:MAG: DUF2057 family protein [Gammaproteobacteria bacterium]|nr:DUF2057 family protein [Gammaproteobacteria bacterium]